MINEPMTQEQIDEAMIRVSDEDDIDPAFPLDALMMIADYHDFDLVETLEFLLQGGSYNSGPQTMIQDIIFASQSNPDRAMLSLRWMTILDQRASEL